jgi:hypothetical protein
MRLKKVVEAADAVAIRAVACLVAILLRAEGRRKTCEAPDTNQ